MTEMKKETQQKEIKDFVEITVIDGFNFFPKYLNFFSGDMRENYWYESRTY